MGYKPTLGGLKKAQAFLTDHGFPMPAFQMDIYADGQGAGFHDRPGKRRSITIDEAIRKFGAASEVTDVRLSNEQGDKFVQFTDLCHVGQYTGMGARESGFDCALEYHRGEPIDFGFKDFMEADLGDQFINLARWGKTKPSLVDRIKFTLFRQIYAAQEYT